MLSLYLCIKRILTVVIIYQLIFIKNDKNVQKLTKAETRDKERCILILYNEFHQKYNYRDDIARKKMRELVNSDANKVINVFSTLI